MQEQEKVETHEKIKFLKNIIDPMTKTSQVANKRIANCFLEREFMP